MAPPRTVGSCGVDQALDALDHADADDRRRADRVLGAPGGQRAELEEGGVPVEQQLDPLAGQELAPLPVPVDVALAPAGPGRGQLGVHGGEALDQGAARWPGRCPRSGSMAVGRTGMGCAEVPPGGGRCRAAPGSHRPADVGRIGP